ncbi:crotonase/enoyl-CoA hydratase family protein [Luminiphilus sp.]|nr:crotonase/enoyl-CoA hydratase family protein [Luminiphilus sp.]
MDVEVEQLGAALVIAINRPAQRNAVTQEVSLAIAAALNCLDEDDALRVGILTGRGGYFCAGMDLKAFVSGQRPELKNRGFGGLTERGPDKPLIAAVEGFALAGGFELALACDLIVAAEGATFGLPEVRRGLVAGSGGLVRLPRRIPRAIAMQYSLTGEPMDAATARQWGLVNEICADGEALAYALKLAERIAVNAPLAVSMSKRIIDESSEWSWEEVWDKQRPLVDLIVASEDATEGSLAFTEKRPAAWTAR